MPPGPAEALRQPPEAVRTRPCVSRARQAAATPKGLGATAPGPPGPGARARTRSGAGSRRRPAGRAGGWAISTCIRTREGSICLATVPGCCTRKAVGDATGATARGTDPLVCEAIDMAARRRPHTTGGDGIPLDSTPAGAASTPPPSSPTTWRATALAPRWAGPGCAGRVPGRKPEGATLKEREGLSDGPPPQEPRPSGIPPPRSSPVHTIRDSSTPPWGTGRRARPTRSTEQQDKQPETPLSELSETRPASRGAKPARVRSCSSRPFLRYAPLCSCKDPGASFR